MDPAALAALLKEFGGWGLSAILLLVVAYQHKQFKECVEARIKEAGEFASLLTKAKESIDFVSAALASRTGIFEQLGTSIQSGNQATALLLSQVMGKLDELGRNLERIAGHRR